MTPTRCFTLILPVLFAAATLAQTPAAPSPATPETAAPTTHAATPATPSLPADPAALLQLAADANGLHAPTLKPWHIHATWQTLGDDKQVKDQGAFDEWWAGDKKYKIALKSATVDRILYHTDHGAFLASHTDSMNWQFVTVQHFIGQPVSTTPFATPLKTTLQAVDMQLGTVPMHCVVQVAVRPDGNPAMLMERDGKSHLLESRYCFSANLPAVRADWIGNGTQAVFNALIQFQGQYLAKKIRSISDGVETDINLDQIELIDPVVDADFIPPADAVPTLEINSFMVGSGVMAGARIGGRNPVYPEMAKINRVQGTVVLQATISREGLIDDLTLISGPRDLQQEALDAVRTWRYRPYLLNGQPVEVRTLINVVFSLGG
jgi:TonB family protein